MFGSALRFCRMPNVLFWLGPSSLVWAISSLFASLHVRVSVSEIIGLYVLANPVAAFCAYLATLTLIAVLALPKRSYATPRRGEMSFQLGRFGISGKVRAGTKLPAAADCSATE